MSLIKWSPFFEPFEGMDKLMEGLMPSTRTGGLVPAVDVYDKEGAVVIETALPGVHPEKVELSVEHGVLTIKGSSERKTEVDEKNYYRKEIRSGSFMRQVALPQGIHEDQAKASFKDGILKIEFPKLQEEKPKSIKIDVNKDQK
jgi:HSP20 family protein